jgi:hypothetical protein
MSYLVITNCTGRKAHPPDPKLRVAPKLTSQKDIRECASVWANNVKNAKHLHKAESLYQGRSIIDSNAVRNALNAHFYVISAGLGLVSSQDLIPSYELTVVDGSPFGKQLQKQGYSNQDWWKKLNGALKKTNSPLKKMISEVDYKQVFIALPSTYLEMIQDDLWGAEPKLLGRVLIFTSTYGTQFIPKEWRHHALPYDERLEDTKSGYAGTRSDFPQRAMRHFLETVWTPKDSLEINIKKTSQNLKKLQKPTLPARRRVDDAQILRIIKKNWKSKLGNSRDLLRYIRDEALVSCEQSRFQKLCSQVRDSKK